MKRMVVPIVALVLIAGCKPDEKTTLKEGYTPTGYTNGEVGRPNQQINDSNNIYTRGSENKTAGQSNPPSSMKTVKPTPSATPGANP